MKKNILATITLAALAMIGTVSFSTEANAQSWRNNSYKACGKQWNRNIR